MSTEKPSEAHGSPAQRVGSGMHLPPCWQHEPSGGVGPALGPGIVPVSATFIVAFMLRRRTSTFASTSCDLVLYLMKAGIEMAARMPTAAIGATSPPAPAWMS